MAHLIDTATFSELMDAGALVARDEQREYATLVTDALSDRGRIALLHADTGLGKSLGYLLPAMQHVFSCGKERPRIIIATHSHALMNQLVATATGKLSTVANAYGLPPLTVGRLLGRMNFVSPDRVEMATYGLTLTNDDAAAIADLTNWSDTIAAFEDEYGCLPCGLTAAQVCMTSDCVNEALDELQRDNLSKDIVITSHAMLAVDLLLDNALLGDQNRSAILIVDEADALASQLSEWTQRRMNLTRLTNLLLPHLTGRQLAPLLTQIEKIQQVVASRRHVWDANCADIARETLGVITKISKLAKLDEQIALELKRQIQSISSTTIGLGVSETGQPAIVGMNPWFTRRFGKYATSAYQSTLMTSGTLSMTQDPVKGMAWFRTELGIDDAILGEMAIFSPHQYGSMSLTLAGPDFPAIYKSKGGQDTELSEAWLDAVALHITNSKGRVVVLTASHKESKVLAAKLSSYEQRSILLHQREIPLRMLMQDFAETVHRHGKAILITAAGHTGLNLTDKSGRVGFDHLVITRITYAPPRNDEVDALADYLLATKGKDLRKSLQQQAFMRTLNSAIRQMRQALGRGIRSPDDNIAVSICDPRFPLSHDLSSKHAALRNIIPIRFALQYRNAQIISMQNDDAETSATEEVFF
ncbi:helicase C-terminal domain-containing protein [Aeromonas veronii]